MSHGLREKFANHMSDKRHTVYRIYKEFLQLNKNANKKWAKDLNEYSTK